eukprot:CAMPEP_0184701396 /NCGR_PEP_ID=MMETSP0313-20130426/19714_1 /TAXON_ID=2792 /ORGANISM="Porphyridium aerugineum, Strain SAG 1380-2" /LENGTH=248 /DNA_ID=CAMNT_0027161441 /DNA_START=260 /DNA_END=1006 /DNA_ORIENTATION=+
MDLSYSMQSMLHFAQSGPGYLAIGGAVVTVVGLYLSYARVPSWVPIFGTTTATLKERFKYYIRVTVASTMFVEMPTTGSAEKLLANRERVLSFDTYDQMVAVALNLKRTMDKKKIKGSGSLFRASSNKFVMISTLDEFVRDRNLITQGENGWMFQDRDDRTEQEGAKQQASMPMDATDKEFADLMKRLTLIKFEVENTQAAREGCKLCGGEGTRICQRCKGFAKSNCNVCNKTGRVTCEWCGGSGLPT